MAEIDYCEGCGHKMHVYKRQVRKQMLPGLIYLYDGVPRRTRDLPVSLGVRSDFTTLQHFNLIEKCYSDNWKITARGKLFLRGLVSIPEYVMVCNNRVLIESVENIKISKIQDIIIDKDIILDNSKGYTQWCNDRIIDKNGHEI